MYINWKSTLLCCLPRLWLSVSFSLSHWPSLYKAHRSRETRRHYTNDQTVWVERDPSENGEYRPRIQQLLGTQLLPPKRRLRIRQVLSFSLSLTHFPGNTGDFDILFYLKAGLWRKLFLGRMIRARLMGPLRRRLLRILYRRETEDRNLTRDSSLFDQLFLISLRFPF